MGHGMNRQSNPVLDPDLAHQLRDMGLDRAFFDLELLPDFTVGASGDQQAQHFSFPLADPVLVLRGLAGRCGDAVNEQGEHPPWRPYRSAVYNTDCLNEFSSGSVFADVAFGPGQKCTQNSFIIVAGTSNQNPHGRTYRFE